MSGEKKIRGPGNGPGGMEREKPEEFKVAWKKLFNYMNRYRIAVILAVILAIVGTALTLIGPDLIKEMTDIISGALPSFDPVTPGGELDLAKIGAIGITLVVIYAISAVLTFAQGYILATVSQRTASSFRTDISRKINRMPLRYFDSAKSGDILSRVTNDVDTIGQSMNQSISTLVTAVTMLLGSIVMMLITNIEMTVTAIVSSLLGFALMILIMGKSQKYFSMQQKNLGAMNGHVAEIYTSHNIVKAYNGEEKAKRQFDLINDELEDNAFKSLFLSGLMMPLMGFIGNLGYVMVCIVGAMLVINGSITIGVIVAFMIYVRLFTQPLSQLSQAFVGMQSVAAASERVFKFLEEEELEDESDKTQVLGDVKGRVEFRDVHFGYTPDKEIIHGFSIVVEPGQKVAIVGPTGAGKTTIVNLLMRFYEVNSGDILIDGISTKNVKRENVHSKFCMVLQDTWVFEGTVRENLVYCKTDVTEEQMIEACKSVGIYHFIMTLPNGFDTVLSDTTTLSAGQRQQLTIARAMIDNSPLLILDEATSSVDTRTEKIIQEAMDKLSENRTSFVIAHRLSTIKNADMILVMKDGNIIETGTHDELLAQGGFYCGLYNSQFDSE